MRHFVLLILLTVLPMAGLARTVDRPNGSTAATEHLYRQLDLLETLAYHVDRVDLARLVVIQKTVHQVISNMDENRRQMRREVTFETMNLIQNLIVQYRYSQVFFGWSTPRAVTSIYSMKMDKTLSDLKVLSEELVANYGYDTSPYTRITANSFRQMQRLMKQLEELPIEDGLKNDLRTLWPAVGHVIALAEQGDRPKAFAAATPVIEKLRALYPQFDRILATNAGFPMVIELQGLTEFFAEYAQMEE